MQKVIRPIRSRRVVTGRAAAPETLPSGARLRLGSTGQRKRIISIAANMNGRSIAVASADGSILMWDLRTGRMIRALAGHDVAAGTLAFVSPTILTYATTDHYPDAGNLIQAELTSTGNAKIEHFETEECAGPLVAVTAGHRTVAYSDYPAFHGGDGSVCIANGRTGKAIRTIAAGHAAAGLVPVLSRSGKLIAISTETTNTYRIPVTSPKTIHIYRTVDGKAVAFIRTARHKRLHKATAALSPAAKKLSIGEEKGKAFIARDTAFAIGYGSHIHLWRIPWGKHLGTLTAPQMTDGTTIIISSPDGKLLAAGGSDQVVRVWDTTSQKLLYAFRGHRGPITSLAFLGNSALASGGNDANVIIWELKAKSPAAVGPPMRVGSVKK